MTEGKPLRPADFPIYTDKNDIITDGGKKVREAISAPVAELSGR